MKNLFFEHVKKEEMQIVCSKNTQQIFKKGEIISREGDEIKNFTYLKSGLVKLYRSDGEKEQIIHIAKPYDYVSILSIFSQTKYQYSVTALEDSVTCHLEMSFVTEMAEKNSVFALDLMRRMSEISDKIIMEMLEIRKRNLRGRVAFMLLYFANEIFEEISFELPVSRKEIAEYIGMSTENVIRTLSEFRKDKIIKIFGKTIEIVDNDGLVRISRLG
ncbi:MAG: Crp/Fnr family transcriptional regulator [Bacteroidales bacterium]|nr:Crp/Fnr family transcriptional regulator [Bacteroidales bacterium]